jgi:hypothetical protein
VSGHRVHDDQSHRVFRVLRLISHLHCFLSKKDLVVGVEGSGNADVLQEIGWIAVY